jgi:hypothetical protein
MVHTAWNTFSATAFRSVRKSICGSGGGRAQRGEHLCHIAHFMESLLLTQQHAAIHVNRLHRSFRLYGKSTCVISEASPRRFKKASCTASRLADTSGADAQNVIKQRSHTAAAARRCAVLLQAFFRAVDRIVSRGGWAKGARESRRALEARGRSRWWSARVVKGA